MHDVAESAFFERTSDGGRKILISGGSRCSILPVALEPEPVAVNENDYQDSARTDPYCTYSPF